MIEPRLLKGFNDVGPADQRPQDFLMKKIINQYEVYGFAPMSTPVLEYADILMDKYGEDEKLVFSFEDHGGRKVGLRYDLTVPLARFVAMNKHSLAFPFKRYQIGKAWRADNTQKGREREFIQCDVDIVGSDSVVADAEVVSAIYQALREMGVEGFQIRFNNRALIYRYLGLEDAETEVVLRALDKTLKIGEAAVIELLKNQVSERAVTAASGLLKLGQGEAALAALAERDAMCAAEAERIKKFVVLCEAFGVHADNLLFDPQTVRGLEYYTGLVFETFVTENIAFGSLASGGRYDTLLEKFSKEKISAVGGSLGFTRAVAYLQTLGSITEPPHKSVGVINLDGVTDEERADLARGLQKGWIKTTLYYEPAKIEKQIKYFEKVGMKYILIYGPAEKEKGIVLLKNLESRHQYEIEARDIDIIKHFYDQEV